MKNIFGIRPLPPGTKFTDTHVLIATWFGAGRLKPASGTMGSLAAIPPGYFIAYHGGFIALTIAAALVLAVGIVSAGWYGQKTGEKDDPAIVIDEVAGLWIAAIPAEKNVTLWLAALLLFRLFDIYKPWPASYFDKRAGSGLDAMLDDVIAGIYAFLFVSGGAYYLTLAGLMP